MFLAWNNTKILTSECIKYDTFWYSSHIYIVSDMFQQLRFTEICDIVYMIGEKPCPLDQVTLFYDLQLFFVSEMLFSI